MGFAKQKVILNSIVLLLLAAGPVAIAALRLWPMPSLREAATTIEVNTPRGEPLAQERVDLDDFGNSLTIQLQRSIVDEVVVEQQIVDTPAPVPVPPTNLAIVLLGTAVESDAQRSKAWILSAGNQAQMVQVGSDIDFESNRLRVKQIEQRKLLFENQGHELSIEMADRGWPN